VQTSAENNPDGGTAFRVVLPAAAAVPERVAQDEGDPVSAAVQRARILVIDDEPAIQTVVARVLSDQHHVTGALRASDALARIAAGARFDVILCDVMMPQMTGIELYETLRARFPGQAERVVFLTGGAFTSGTAQFLEVNTRPVVHKPFDARKLRAVVNQFAGSVGTPTRAV
jgi:CheY-like chemotaxis protein